MIIEINVYLVELLLIYCASVTGQILLLLAIYDYVSRTENTVLID
jgi:hypothetical protein